MCHCANSVGDIGCARWVLLALLVYEASCARVAAFVEVFVAGCFLRGVGAWSIALLMIVSLFHCVVSGSVIYLCNPTPFHVLGATFAEGLR